MGKVVRGWIPETQEWMPPPSFVTMPPRIYTGPPILQEERNSDLDDISESEDGAASEDDRARGQSSATVSDRPTHKSSDQSPPRRNEIAQSVPLGGRHESEQRAPSKAEYIASLKRP